MLKILAIIALLFIGRIWAAGLSCNSCGSECAPACGTRRFRICCFNHLKMKRGERGQLDLGDDEDFIAEKAILLLPKTERWYKKLDIDADPYSIN